MSDVERGDGTVIEFWFDFASGYAYFAAQDIDAVAERLGRRILWRPYMLGAAFKRTGARGLSSTPLKSDYALRDWKRIARQKGVPFDLPDGHPVVALAATRAHYWIERSAPETCGPFARALLNGYFRQGLDVSSPEAVAEVASRFGFKASDVMDGVADPEIKAVARAHGDDAIERGAFGSPFFFVDGEPFWGWDRLTMLEDWVRQGGW